ncbi:MAG: iron-containing alcohol dehydrogenase [Caldilineales bacterium]|nr:iron-containing alcohol dehydrogenase [Caldilineales bacterium]
MSFTYHLPTKIIFGQPALEALRAELAALQAERVLLVSDAGLARIGLVEQFRAGLSDDGRQVGAFADIGTNPTTAEVTAGLAQAQDLNSQAIVALGGGSAIDVAKAIAMLMANGGSYADYQWGGKAISQRSLPLLATPTTAGTGSEVTKVAVIVDPERPFKKGVLNPLMFPHAAIIDPELTRSLPLLLTAATGMDAFSHALESYTGRRANPYTDQFALAALETIGWALPRAVTDGNDMQAREAMMLAAVWAGTAMDHAGLGLIHSLSGPLTGALHLHHGLANAILLPHVLRFNLPAIPPDRRRRLNTITGLAADAPGETLVDHLVGFLRGLGLTARLDEVSDLSGLSDFSGLAADTLRMAMTPNNPRTVTAGDVETILAQLTAASPDSL